MQVGTIVRLCLAALALSVATQSAQAQDGDVCIRGNGTNFYFGSIALQINTLTVARDAPAGTILYKQQINQPGMGLTLQCPVVSGVRTDYFILVSAPSITGYSAGVYAGKIYETGVPGIGIAWYGGAGVGAFGPGYTQTPAVSGGCAGSTGVGAPPSGSCFASGLKFPPDAALLLIKTGPAGTGTINGAALGRAQMTTGIGNSNLYIDAEVAVTGTIQIVGVTCTTPNVSVALGKQQMSSLKGIGAGPGSYSPTVNFAIALTGCPGFPGRAAVSDPSLAASSGVGAWTPNILGLQLDASTTVIDASTGERVLGLTAGSGTATGVGVQVLKADGSPMPLFRSVPQNVALDANTNSVNISLGARYFQTASKMTGGRANAVMTYTLSYQ
ncbi:fimbrial protein [Janthinobacterium sp. NKUCC06_STL]|uniref:fimbrial protein n=1 Tax=Janthinobacterium sp. NKUCC06_STL TaxID=2842127 RepID=UPI001C5AB80A|nr:fimbrial protein [Janthinobacterium sp. NKUCC06_STL]MBW3512200.1 type 1 fimbrial protein [Janthinobacterium sp. NKUCC06_STL]